MILKPWREIARPHRDVLQGTFRQAEFAADITQVVQGTAPPEYGDAEQFFARTYITEGMRLLLISVARRLAGLGGDPVIQLQTAFGGGKTHALLAVYHLASRSVPTFRLPGIPPLLDEAGIPDLPEARVAVIDGINLSPGQPRTYKAITVRTLWGELAWQLLGEAGYAMVAESDRNGTSPGKEILAELLRRAAPCVILMDELVAFIRQLEPGRSYPAGTFDSNVSFIQALTEAVKIVPKSVLLASLPESDVEAGGTLGERALEALEKFFARVESVWKPVATEEAFEIVRRRLFEDAGDRAQVEEVCRQFAELYRQHPDRFPAETQGNAYEERLRRSYPIHPEVFDRLYGDWSTLEKFQRTRGVLQLLALVIHRLWNSDNRDALIMPGSLPLDDIHVRTKSLHYLPPGWEPVIEQEVDGPRSVPAEMDGHDTRLGSVQAARRTARTIFLGSAPAAADHPVRGMETARILLGAVQPGQSVGVFEDALRRLRDRLHYLYADRDRYWFDTRPNLRREMEMRKRRVEREEADAQLRKTLLHVLRGRHRFGGIHVFTPDADIPDDCGTGPRLVVLPPTAPWARVGENAAQKEAERILRQRGNQPRKRRNRLIFLAPDADVVRRAREQARVFLAWDSIVTDIEGGNLNHDIVHLRQAQRHRDRAREDLAQIVREAWRWLVAPAEEFERGKPRLIWEAVPVSPSAPSLMEEIEHRLREEEWVIYEWSPIHLRHLLEQWYFKDGRVEVRARKVWQDTCDYLYMPRLLNEGVFRDAVARGVASEDYFGFAAGREGERYLGFVFGDAGADIVLDDAALLIAREAARAWRAQGQGGEETDIGTGPGGVTPPEPPPTGTGRGERRAPPARRFYGTVTLDPLRAAMDFSTIMEEVVQHFTTRPGVQVRILVEIEADADGGFGEDLQRIIRENCRTLKFQSAEFDAGDEHGS